MKQRHQYMKWALLFILVQLVTTGLSSTNVGEISSNSFKELLKRLGEHKSDVARTWQENAVLRRCPGRSSSEEKIPGGVRAEGVHGKVSNWMVWIHNTTGFTCGGTRISKRHILTSAHCFFKPHPHEEGSDRNRDCGTLLDVHYEAILRPNNGSGYEERRIVRVLLNKDFKKFPDGIYHNDAAIAVLDTKFHTGLEPGFCLNYNTPSMPGERDKCYTVGLGYTVKRSEAVRPRTTPAEARHTGITVVRCSDIIGRPRGEHEIRCSSNAGALEGDSGGPVICYVNGERGRKPYLMGIISQVHRETEDYIIMHNARYDRSIEEFLKADKRSFHSCPVPQ